MIRSFKEWLTAVEAHYGDIMHFDDATTVRTMRRFELETIVFHEKVAGPLDEASSAEYLEAFSDDIAEAKANVEICDKWLAERGLKP